MALGAHLFPPPLPPSMLRFTGIQSYSYMEQRKFETDVDRMTGIERATLQLRRPRTNRLSYVCFRNLLQILKKTYCLCHVNSQDVKDIDNWNFRKFNCFTINGSCKVIKIFVPCIIRLISCPAIACTARCLLFSFALGLLRISEAPP